MTLKEILENPKKLTKVKLIAGINEFLADPNMPMSEKVRAYKQLTIVMGIDQAMGIPTKQKVEDYVRQIQQPDIRYTPKPGTPAGDDLVRWYDELDRRGGYSGD